MTVGYSSNFLNQICKELRQNRERLIPPDWNIPFESAEYTEIWIPTGGCSWDRQGYCTECNYEYPYPVKPDSMVLAVKKALSHIKVTPSRLLISSYSILDEKEIPAEARQEIFELLAKTDIPTILCETRPETVSYSVIHECRDILDEKNFEVEIGVESMNDFIRKWCINKGLKKETITKALSIIRDAGATSFVNLLIGAPFLSTSEVVSDIEESINKAINIGADNIVLFPVHVKSHTLVKWLFDRNLYRPPSLWALIEIMKRSDNILLPHIFYSWVEPKTSLGLTTEFSPTTCEQCYPEAIHNLQRYRFSRNLKSLNWLFQHHCDCRNQWYTELQHRPNTLLVDRLIDIFPRIGKRILGDNWWETNGDDVLRELRNSWVYEGSQTLDLAPQNSQIHNNLMER